MAEEKEVDEQNDSMTYAGTGVDYNVMDAFKREAQAAAASTDGNIQRFGFSVVEWTRGESVFLVKTPFGYLAHVEEGLGTKNLVADSLSIIAREVGNLQGKSYYGQISQDTVAMNVNDMITLGASPLSVAMHLAVGVSDWFDDEVRSSDLIDGWRRACNLSRCVWGPGETPTLKDIVIPNTVVLSCSALGIVPSEERLIKRNVCHGDSIIFIESSGIHANGLTLARKIADGLPKGYLTELSDGRTYGETLLDPTYIYVALVEECLNQGIDIHYAVNITGHGWRKLMRLDESFTYVVERLPRQMPIFDFIQEHGNITDMEMFGNLNVGAGFALYVPPSDEEAVIKIARSVLGLDAWNGGYIEQSQEKKVVIVPKNLEFLGETLNIR